MSEQKSSEQRNRRRQLAALHRPTPPGRADATPQLASSARRQVIPKSTRVVTVGMSAILPRLAVGGAGIEAMGDSR
jgi:hypothetical protein